MNSDSDTPSIWLYSLFFLIVHAINLFYGILFRHGLGVFSKNLITKFEKITLIRWLEPNEIQIEQFFILLMQIS